VEAARAAARVEVEPDWGVEGGIDMVGYCERWRVSGFDRTGIGMDDGTGCVGGEACEENFHQGLKFRMGGGMDPEILFHFLDGLLGMALSGLGLLVCLGREKMSEEIVETGLVGKREKGWFSLFDHKGLAERTCRGRTT
jgi:hypothetical protein